MRKSTKQNILTVVIIVAIIALIGIIVYVMYEEKIKENNKVQNATLIESVNNTTNNTVQEEKEQPKKEEEEQPKQDEYIGKEEEETNKEEDTQMTKDEKAIQLAKDQWGEDSSVTFNIEEKKDNIYYIAVKSNATVVAWYEVNTETWTISEFY